MRQSQLAKDLFRGRGLDGAGMSLFPAVVRQRLEIRPVQPRQSNLRWTFNLERVFLKNGESWICGFTPWIRAFGTGVNDVCQGCRDRMRNHGF